MTDKKLFNILLLTIAISLVLLFISIVFQISFLFSLSLIIILISIISSILLFVTCYKKSGLLINELDKKIDNYTTNYEYDNAIKFLEEEISNTFYNSYKSNCRINLMVIYLIQDKIELCVEMLNTIKDQYFIQNTYYYKMLIYLDNNQVEYAKIITKHIMKLNEAIYSVQKANTAKIMSIVDTGVQESYQKIKTNFPIVYRIIDKYKK